MTTPVAQQAEDAQERQRLQAKVSELTVRCEQLQREQQQSQSALSAERDRANAKIAQQVQELESLRRSLQELRNENA